MSASPLQFGAPLQAAEFAKYSALGNDYLVVDGATFGVLDASRVRVLCDRHRGLGSDGILVRVPPPASSPAATGLRIFNPDGSEAEKSGNGLRIFARFLYEFGYVTTPHIAIHTAGGEVTADIHTAHNAVVAVEVAMGRARVEAVDEPLQVGHESLTVTVVSMGNPHCVHFVQQLDVDTLHRLGPRIEHHPRFPHRTNVQFVRVHSRERLDILIWERGAGETLASGSSSCAAAVAAVKHDLVNPHVVVHMPGGTLDIHVSDTLDVVMRGPATPVCRGRAFL